MQVRILDCLAQARDLGEVENYIPQARQIMQKAKQDLCKGRVPLEELMVTQSLSREVERYKSPSPAARSAGQLLMAGKSVAPGMFMRFVFIRGRERVRAWELVIDPRTVDVKRYVELLERAGSGILEVFVAEECPPLLKMKLLEWTHATV